ncbi:MAG TPA: YqiA/YcfP family alpha/beta fold hydrolase [Bryobacteraceae bacterium]|nr:YqiA/YcfP family alpha/beta fold hydrolase [Bryobacteraceae bacterium]
MNRIVYLHGFASSPLSTKSQFFKNKFAGFPFDIPELDEGNFQAMTVSRQLGVVERAVHGDPVILMGSSLGGYLAALYAARHTNVDRLVLLAPAFQFPSRWRARYSSAELDDWEKTGARDFYHYAYKQNRPLGYQFVRDALQFEDEPDFHQPALVLHGLGDEVVPPTVSEQFAGHHPNVTLRLVESGHELTDQLELLWAETAMFLGFQNR